MAPIDGVVAAMTSSLPGFTTEMIAEAADAASAVVRGYCKQPFSLVTDDVAVVTTGGWYATLPAMPVVAVSKVEVKNINLDGSVSWLEITAYDYAPNGTLYPTLVQANSWPLDELPGGLRVTYTHGYAVVPDDVITTAARLGARLARNPDISVGYRIGEKDEKFYGASGKGQGDLTAYDKYVLDQYAIETIR